MFIYPLLVHYFSVYTHPWTKLIVCVYVSESEGREKESVFVRERIILKLIVNVF